MDLPIDEYEAQVRRARQTARQVLACGFISLAVGWLIVVTCVIAWLGFEKLLNVELPRGWFAVAWSGEAAAWNR